MFVAPRPWCPPPVNLRLADPEIHVFAFSLDLPDSSVGGLESLLSPNETARAGRFKHAEDRRRFIVGRAGLRSILAEYLGSIPTDIRFTYDTVGKPHLDDTMGERIRFNLSGSEGVGVLAVGRGHDLGVDIERVRPFPNALPIADRLFTDQEHRDLGALPRKQLDAAFFSLWTRKEAVVKCLGRGLTFPLDSFSLSGWPDGAEHLVLQTTEGPSDRWVLPLPPPSDGYVAALASDAALLTVRCFRWPGS